MENVEKSSTPIIRGFIGSVNLFKQDQKVTYRAFLCAENGSRVVLPAKTFQLKDKANMLRTANLLALKQMIKALMDTTNDKVILYFYATDDTVAFEYNNEYLKEGEFKGQSKQIREWKNIIKLLDDSNIELHIKESNSCLSGMNKLKGDNV